MKIVPYLITVFVSVTLSYLSTLWLLDNAESIKVETITVDKLVVDHIDAHLVNMEYGSVRLRDSSGPTPGIVLNVGNDFAGIQVFSKDKTAYLWASKDRGLERNP